MRKILGLAVSAALALASLGAVQVTRQYCDKNAERAVSNAVQVAENYIPTIARPIIGNVVTNYLLEEGRVITNVTYEVHNIIETNSTHYIWSTNYITTVVSNTEIRLSNFPYNSFNESTITVSNSTAANVSIPSSSSILNVDIDGFDGAMFSSFLFVDSLADEWTMNVNHDTNELYVAHLDSDINTFGSLGSGKYIFTFMTPMTNVLLVTVNKLILY